VSYKYSSVYGICYYYKINGFQFLKNTPELQSKPKKNRRVQAEQIHKHKKERPEAKRKELADTFKVSERTIQRLHILKKDTRAQAEQIRKYQKEHPEAKRKELADTFKVSERTIWRRLKDKF
jgi:DeoR/GlpR family transcriptional regulator of sugar metabolism